jgi:hypothetical protein
VLQMGRLEAWHICRVGQNRIYAPYMTVYLVISLLKTLYIHRIYMVLANPTHLIVWKDQSVFAGSETIIGLARTIYIRCIYGAYIRSYTVHVYGHIEIASYREITKYTVINGACIWFWPTLNIC